MGVRLWSSEGSTGGGTVPLPVLVQPELGGLWRTVPSRERCWETQLTLSRRDSAVFAGFRQGLVSVGSPGAGDTHWLDVESGRISSFPSAIVITPVQAGTAMGSDCTWMFVPLARGRFSTVSSSTVSDGTLVLARSQLSRLTRLVRRFWRICASDVRGATRWRIAVRRARRLSGSSSPGLSTCGSPRGAGPRLRQVG